MPWNDLNENDPWLDLRSQMNLVGPTAHNALQPGAGFPDQSWIDGTDTIDTIVSPANLRAQWENMPIAQAFVNFQGMNGATPLVKDSFNVSSVQQVGNIFRVNYSTPIDQPNYLAFATYNNGTNGNQDDGFVGGNNAGAVHVNQVSINSTELTLCRADGQIRDSFYRMCLVVI